jgi:hypothetical protein
LTGYSTSGLVETWKLGLVSQVNDQIRLRTSWSLDIRAPQISELFSAGHSLDAELPLSDQFTFLSVLRDPGRQSRASAGKSRHRIGRRGADT